MNELLLKLLQRQDLSFAESQQAIEWIMSENASPVKAAAYLSMLQVKGATIEEIAGAALAMRDKSAKIKAPPQVIDTCSTGGNGISTFNISTCAAIIAAAAGAVVAKHGNRSNTRKSGSAEALEALNVNLQISLNKVEECIAKIGLCFCYAIMHHPAMKYAAPIRKELGIPTIFNMLGPLTNPANAQRQVMGVPKPELTGIMAHVLQRLGATHVMIVHGMDGLCELTTTADTVVAELKNGVVNEYVITPEQLGLKRGNLDDIRIATPKESARMIEQILVGENIGTARDVALLNAAAALVVADMAPNLKEGLAKAADAVYSGKATAKLKALIDFTNEK